MVVLQLPMVTYNTLYSAFDQGPRRKDEYHVVVDLSIINNHNYFRSEVGLDWSIEDLFKTIASEAVPDIFCIEEWFEDLDINNLSYYKTPFSHE
ncbi:hypothetical protein KI387_020691, partial [Taxus chinensis]